MEADEWSDRKSFTPGIIMILAGAITTTLTFLMLFIEQRRGLDAYCWTDFGPILPGADDTHLPVGEFSWLPLGTACKYFYSDLGTYKTYDPGWAYTFFLCIGILLALLGIIITFKRLKN
ncbi:hypothetical protein AL755_13305 [Arthrobacter sp. ERGS1:01]|nr:hypothetical protein AL755_13305 [Arthrobacter sp. ERGS1:01]